MIVGSVLPIALRRQAEDNGAHRSAGPDHDWWFLRFDISEAAIEPQRFLQSYCDWPLPMSVRGHKTDVIRIIRSPCRRL
jgi:hypothetical protein